MKRILCTILVLLLSLSVFAMPAMAASSTASLTGSGSVRAGNTVTLTFYLSGSNIFAASGTLSYDESQVQLVKTEKKIGGSWAVDFNGNNFVAYDNNLEKPISSKTAVFSATFKVKSNLTVGTAVKISCTNLVTSDGSADTNVSTASHTFTVAAPVSGDNTLKSLTVNNATISPAFNPNTTSYTAEVPFEVERLDLSVQVNNGGSKIYVNSPELTAGGTTNVTITVTAENGSTRTYTIAVTRAQDPNYVPSSNNNLASIKVQGYVLSPVFDTKVTEYVVWLPYETESVSVTATPADYKASVRIEGGKELIAGADNEIKVICAAEDGTEKVYTVIAKRAAAHGSTEPTVPETTEAPETTVPEPSKAPETTQAPETTAPAAPSEPGNAGGIQTWVLIVACVAFLVLGAVAGIIVDKKLLNK